MNSPLPWFVRARLKPRQLLLVLALEELGTMQRAAESLHLTQPAASKLLKDLEDALGAPLFERLPRGMRATWYGEALVRHARAAVASLDLAQAEVQDILAGGAGQVRIGAITSPALTLLPPALSRLTQAHPRLRLSVDVEPSDVLMERLLQGRLDLLVARPAPQHDKAALRYEPLSGEGVCAVARPAHPWQQRAGLDLAGVAEAGWIVPPAGSVLRHRFEVMFQQAGLPPPSRLIETSALLFTTRMLAESDMLAVVTTDVAHYYAGHGVVAVLPLTLPCRMDDFGLITHAERPVSPAAERVLEALREEAAGLYGG